MWKWLRYEDEGLVDYSPKEYPSVRLSYAIIPGFWWEVIAGDLEFSFEGSPKGFVQTASCCFDPTPEETERAQRIAQGLIAKYITLK